MIITKMLLEIKHIIKQNSLAYILYMYIFMSITILYNIHIVVIIKVKKYFYALMILYMLLSHSLYLYTFILFYMNIEFFWNSFINFTISFSDTL